MRRRVPFVDVGGSEVEHLEDLSVIVIRVAVYMVIRVQVASLSRRHICWRVFRRIVAEKSAVIVSTAGKR